MAKKEEKKSFVSKILTNRILRAIIAISVFGCLFVGLILLGLHLYTKHGESVLVPSVQGLQVTEASAILRKSLLECEVVDSVFLTGGTPGAIIDQIPEAESRVKKGRVIFLTMQAKSVEMITIPALKDFSQRQAVATLNSLGFMNITTSEVPSAYRGLVLDVVSGGKTVELNSKLPKGAPVTLVVGAGGEILIDSLIDIIPYVDPADLPLNNEPTTDNSFFE